MPFDAAQFALATSGALVGAAITAAGYLGKRHITRARASERLDFLAKLVDLKAKLEGRGVSFSDIEGLEHYLAGKRDREADGEVLSLMELTAVNDETALDRAQTALVAARQALAAEIEAAADLPEQDRIAFEEAHLAWMRFCAAEVRRTELSFVGSSFARLIVTTEETTLTRDRADALNAQRFARLLRG